MIDFEEKKPEEFDGLQLKIAGPEEILAWSHGEITKPETINYRTQRAEKDGLFCEKIFGPEKDWECYCGKYRKIRYKGVVCDRCGVEVTRSIVRRERMGHIKLAVPVSHIWFLRGVPSRIGLILDVSVQKLEKVTYFAAYIITRVDEKAKEKAFNDIGREYKAKLKTIQGKEAKKDLKMAYEKAKDELLKIKKLEIISELTFRFLSQKYSEVFTAGIGAEALRDICKDINLEKLALELEEQLKHVESLQKRKVLQRLRLVRGFQRAGIKPEWMFLVNLPVMPADLRPMVQLDGGRYATSDVNDLYRRVINRNNRLKRLLELNAPEVICRNEKRMLQEAIDALIDNSARRGQKAVMAATGQKRQLKSLADQLKGKQGRFRQNLLGKRVDYSGRSVIVVGPELKLHQCGLPKTMALELFKPFIINKLIEREIVFNIRGARRLIEEGVDEVWAILEEVTERYHVLLNRAPTLHRLGVQAFKPVLIEGLAIQVHPMVCKAFNADFDGDQMAVHLPLSEKAQRESREIMLSSVNLFKPATGDPIIAPSQDITLGCYFMTKIKAGLRGEGKIFSCPEEAILAYQLDIIDLQAAVKVRINSAKSGEIIDTSVGRVIFNNVLPPEIGFKNKDMTQKELKLVSEEIIHLLGTEKAPDIMDKIKSLGFKYATKSGISWGMDDIVVPKDKPRIVEEAMKEVEQIRKQYQEGLLTRIERRSRVIEIWSKVKNKIAALMPKTLDPDGSIYTIFNSGARGNWGQATQMGGMKGLVVNPASETLELPVISSFKEGFNVLEYFISTHGGRKGLADTALKTASAGYLTRRLVDVAQDVIVLDEDCGDKEGIIIYKRDLEDLGISFGSQLTGRVILEEVTANGKVIAKKHELLTKKKALEVEATGIDKLRVRSVISCKSRFGICQQCYGYDLGRNKLVEKGEAVGIVTAQAIGEPGTQLTLRTFHTGGVAGGADITQGLPRVEEIFEARVPKGKAALSELNGKVIDIKDNKGQKIINIEGWQELKSKKRKKISKEYVVPPQTGVWVQKGDEVFQGQQIWEGSVDLKELYKLAGQEALQRYVIKEIQEIYSTQGEGLNNKHIEVIVHQMLSRVRVKDVGETSLLAGAVIEKDIFFGANDKAKKESKKPGTAVQLLMGITKVALSTESFLSSASFQETVRVLIKAASEGRIDHLRGLKENVIIGKLIPAGTGYREMMEEKKWQEEQKAK